MENKAGPTALILTRLKLPVLDRTGMAPASELFKGGYILWEPSMSPQIILIGTGSEVHTVLEAAKILQGKGVAARVISLPSWEIFSRQTPEYRDKVLPPATKVRLSVEAGTTIGWERYVGLEGMALGVTRFGASAPGEVVLKQYGLIPQKVVDLALKMV
jgi:transketolase